MITKITLVTLLAFSCTCGFSQKTETHLKAEPFPMTAVQLLEGPFQHATELNIQSLLAYDPDRLLARFRKEAGLEPRAEAYGGWEGQSLAGHSLGHHLSGCALMYQTTGDQRFLDRVNYIVDELAACQVADGDGYIGAFPRGKQVFEEEVARGQIRSQLFDLNGIWSPMYTQHKVLAGLRDAYRLTGNRKALAVAAGFADWLGTVVSGLSDEQIQTMLHTEHGGIQEVLADLYADTHEERYLALARKLHHKAILDSLAMGVDILPNKHGNTQIPKLIAQARLFELTGEESARRAAEFFWSTVVHHHSYVTGGHGNHEYFGQPDRLRNRLSDETTETCNVYNMLKLSRHLFLWEPRAEVADFYERALFNHILSSQNPENGRVVYNLSLEMGGHKAFQNPGWFTCCIGAGMENHSKYVADIYYHNYEALYVSQYLASTLRWEEKGLLLTQSTRYPEEQGSTFTIEARQPVAFTLALRYPAWAENGMTVLVNDQPQPIAEQPGHYVLLDRTWNDGDRIAVQFPFSLRLNPMPDDADRIAVSYGPLVLAADLGPVTETPAKVPVFLSAGRDPETWLEAAPGLVNTFRTKEIDQPRDVVFRPFYRIYDRNYSVYIDLLTPEKLAARQAAEQAEQQRREALLVMTYDYFQPGDSTAEQEYRFQGERTEALTFKDRRARVAERGGWFSCRMNVLPDQPMALVVDYWGGYTGSKTFDILVDGQRIATENISGKRDGAFIDVAYPIPADLTRGKQRVEVKFSPLEGHRAGPVFGVRTIRR